jgi:regulatory protein
MIITRLDYSDKQENSTHKSAGKVSKVNVFIDNEYAFWLFPNEIRIYSLDEGVEIDSKTYNEIIQEVILNRAKKKALSILKFMDRTEQELKNKLSEAGYTENIIHEVLDYVCSYGYINDERFATAYITARKNNKSKIILRMDLLRKGIKKEIIDNVIHKEYENDENEDPELTAIKKAIAKKNIDPANLTWEEKQKLLSSLYRKGFEIDKINRVLM